MTGRVLGTIAAFLAGTSIASGQVPPDIEAGLRKIGQIVDPACTARLYRPLMPKNDYNTYWPPDAASAVFTGQLYPGVTIARDQSFGPNPKDLVDIFTPDKGGGNRPILIYVPGGGGNKIEQQAREGNAFYDNIGRWAVKNGMVGVTVQRHPGTNWDDPARDISMAVDWIKANAGKYKGDGNRMIIWAHSAGNGPVGTYVAHPERWKDGVQVKGAIFMSGVDIAIPGIGRAGGPGGGGAPGGRGNAGGGGNPLAGAGAACGLTNALGGNGAVAGPSGVAPVAARGTGAGAPGGGVPDGGAAGRGAAGGGRGQLTPEQQAERDNLPGFKATPVKIMLIRAELDPGVMGDMLAGDKAAHDALCALDGSNARDGVGHCPALLFARGESHMSEVFSIDTNDKTVSGPILAFIKKIK